MFNLMLVDQLPSVVSCSLPIREQRLSLSTDSRSATAADLFVAIKGEKFDAIDFIPAVLARGVRNIVYKYSDDNEAKLAPLKQEHQDCQFIAVSSAEQFLAELSSKHMMQWKAKGGLVVGITGSNGKTTHKEMLTHLLESLMPGQIHATKGNLNNHLGVPFTILQLEETHRVAIVEMGTNHPGEIAPLCAMAQPDAGIITNIGDSHLEFFKNRQGVFADKRSLFDSIALNPSAKKLFVHTAADALLCSLPREKWVVSFGESASATIKVEIGTSYLQWQGHRVENPYLVGKHNYSNLACCLILAEKIWGQADQLVAAAVRFVPKANRSQILTINQQQFYLDAYNANPSSMCAALDAVMQSKLFDPQQTLFILGDMNELGESAADLHRQVGEHCRRLGVVHVAFVGRYHQFYLEGWGGQALLFGHTAELLEKWPDIKANYANFFIKGSRTLQLESLTAIT